MDEYMLRELMRRGGMGNEGADDVSRRFKEFMMREDNSGKHMMDYDNFTDRGMYQDFPRSRRVRREMGESEFYEMINREKSVNFPELKRMFENMSPEDKKRMWKYMTTMHEHYGGRHYNNNTYARETVAEMFHTENSHKHMGERYKMEKAEEVFRKYKELLPEDVTVADVYVAINATYHRFTLLFKSWFGDNIDTKIIEAAIVFWFKDEECPDGDKVWEFYQEK